jgi:hypothetical protein
MLLRAGQSSCLSRISHSAGSVRTLRTQFHSAMNALSRSSATPFTARNESSEALSSAWFITLGISTCDDHGAWHIQYLVKRDTAGHPQSYFSPKDAQHWYWAMDGFQVHGDLWVLLLCVEAATTQTTGTMNFRICGSDLAQISQIHRDSQNWQVSIQPLVSNGAGAYPSATAVIHDDFANLFAVYETGKRPLIVARIPLSGLNEPKANLQCLALDGSWKGGFKPADAKEIMKQGEF